MTLNIPNADLAVYTVPFTQSPSLKARNASLPSETTIIPILATFNPFLIFSYLAFKIFESSRFVTTSGFDLVICRNVTIYFTEEAKWELNTKFFNSLIEGGVLFIGSTEVMLEASKIGFSTMGVSFYQKPGKSLKNRLTIIGNNTVKA